MKSQGYGSGNRGAGEHLDAAAVDAHTMLPRLLQACPGTRVVFDRYGLKGCGGRWGPVESVGFFARAHGVDPQRLIGELREVVRQARGQSAVQSLPVATLPAVEDTIYRRYFMAGIAVILTAGATWGAYLLWKIGLGGSFTGVSIHEVNAHGHAQIFGWVGLFIMGFAYQAFPRMWQTTLRWPRLAVTAFAAMLIGVAVRSVTMALSDSWDQAAIWTLAVAVLQIAAVTCFVLQIGLTWWRSEARIEPYLGFVLMALAWFVIQAVADAWHTWNTMTAATQDELLWYIATYQAPLRDLQIHGLALFMILGVSLRMLPALFGVPRTSDRRAWAALVVLTAAVVGQTLLFVAWRWTGNAMLVRGLLLTWVMLAVGAVLVAWPWRLWRAIPQSDRSAKFVRAAYAWLAVSLLMLLLLPMYQWISGIAFSHAYYGAVRHAITVGFISLMIMGIAAKVVPTLNGIDVRGLSPLWGPFLLVNFGCFLRVSTQTLTDWHEVYFSVVGVSGVLEVAGLGWWGLGLVAIMVRGKRSERVEALAQDESTSRPIRIEPHHRVAQVLAWFPQTAAVFDRFGYAPLRSAWMRHTVARRVSLAQAAAFRGVNLTELLASLRSVATGAAGHDASHDACQGRCEQCDHTEGALSEARTVRGVEAVS